MARPTSRWNRPLRHSKKLLAVWIVSAALAAVALLGAGFAIGHSLFSGDHAHPHRGSIASSSSPDQPNQVIPHESGSTIVVDPGHGTKFARGGANHEAELVLAVSKKIVAILTERGIHAVLTHERCDRTENLAPNPDADNIARAEMANQRNAALFLRIHADAPTGPSAIYYPERHPDRHVAEASHRAASAIWSHVLPFIRTCGWSYSRTVLTDAETAIGAQQGGLLTGSKASRVPVVLIELAPLTDSSVRFLSASANEARYAEAICDGVVDFLESR